MARPDVEDIYPATPVQEGILFESLLRPESGVYWGQFAFLIRGELDLTHFREVWFHVEARHAALRPPSIRDQRGRLLQVVRGTIELPWTETSRHLSPGAPAVDTLSVKGPSCEAIFQPGPPDEFLSINPMFAPSAGFPETNGAAVKVRNGRLPASVVEMLESWGCRVTGIPADKHDRPATTLQVATNAALPSRYAFPKHGIRCRQRAAGRDPSPPQDTKTTRTNSGGRSEVYSAIQPQDPHVK